MTVTSHMISFTIRGASLTEQARERMGDGDWKGALAHLVDNLVGMSYDQAIGIIEGRFKLTGENDTILMVAEDPDVMQQLQERYTAEYCLGQFVRDGKAMYEPYLVIDTLGQADYALALALPEYRDGAMPDFVARERWTSELQSVYAKSAYAPVLPARSLELRAMHYAENPRTDRALLMSRTRQNDVIVLFRQVAEGVAPFWRENDNTCFKKAYEAARSYLPTSGYAQRYGFIHPDEAAKPEPVAATVSLSAEEQQELEAKLAAEHAASEAFAARQQAEALALRERITAFADGDSEYGWQDYRWRDPKDGTYLSLRAPKRALYCYALSQTSAHALMPQYEAISPDSFKTAEDNPFHTDVWLGCGFAIDAKTYRHDSREYRAILDLMFEVQRTLLNFEVQVLARGPEVSGTVVFADSENIDRNSILVVPHAGVEFELQAMAAGAVICEAGGRLAHLVTVCREQDKPIMRMDGACSKLSPGQSVKVHPATGRVTIWALGTSGQDPQ